MAAVWQIGSNQNAIIFSTKALYLSLGDHYEYLSNTCKIKPEQVGEDIIDKISSYKGMDSRHIIREYKYSIQNFMGHIHGGDYVLMKRLDDMAVVAKVRGYGEHVTASKEYGAGEYGLYYYIDIDIEHPKVPLSALPILQGSDDFILRQRLDGKDYEKYYTQFDKPYRDWEKEIKAKRYED